MRLASGWNGMPDPDSWSGVPPIAYVASGPLPPVGRLPKDMDLTSHFFSHPWIYPQDKGCSGYRGAS